MKTISKYRLMERDSELGLAEHGVRKYDEAIGRFTAPDALWEKYVGWTPYQYSLNNPVMFQDGNGYEVDFSALFLDDGSGPNPESVALAHNIIDELREMSGLDLDLNEDNKLISLGSLNNSQASEKMANFIIDAIKKEDIVSVNETFERTQGGGLEIFINKSQIKSFETSKNLNSKTMGFGMVFLHELSHTRVGGSLTDGGQSPGQAATFINSFRSELDSKNTVGVKPYGIRETYSAQNFNNKNVIWFRNPTGSVIVK